MRRCGVLLRKDLPPACVMRKPGVANAKERTREIGRNIPPLLARNAALPCSGAALGVTAAARQRLAVAAWICLAMVTRGGHSRPIGLAAFERRPTRGETRGACSTGRVGPAFA